MIEIKTFGGRVLYTAETATDVRTALIEAVKERADLRGADLRRADLRGADLRGADLRRADLRGAYLRGADLQGADLRGAYLRGAYLQGADLRGADLRGAYLRGAYLRGADLQGAYLRGAYLQGADLRGADEDLDHPFYTIRSDVWTILDAAPAEVPALRDALIGGRVNGSAYDGACACLVGTIANAQGVSAGTVPGIVCNASRPAEQWFMPILEGHRAVETFDGDTTFATEGEFRAAWALRWVDQWTASRTAIAAVLSPAA